MHSPMTRAVSVRRGEGRGRDPRSTVAVGQADGQPTQPAHRQVTQAHPWPLHSRGPPLAIPRFDGTGCGLTAASHIASQTRCRMSGPPIHPKGTRPILAIPFRHRNGPRSGGFGRLEACLRDATPGVRPSIRGPRSRETMLTQRDDSLGSIRVILEMDGQTRKRLRRAFNESDGERFEAFAINACETETVVRVQAYILLAWHIAMAIREPETALASTEKAIAKARESDHPHKAEMVDTLRQAQKELQNDGHQSDIENYLRGAYSMTIVGPEGAD